MRSGVERILQSDRATYIALLFTVNKIAISSEELFGDLMNCQTILIWLPYIHEWELCGSRKRENVTERAKRERGWERGGGVVERKGDRAGGRHKERDIHR